jgi:uncharacterized surface protein with fasciclin (FAS1) repeats
MMVLRFSKPVKKFVVFMGVAGALVTMPVLAQKKPAPSSEAQPPTMQPQSQPPTMQPQSQEKPMTPSDSPSLGSTTQGKSVVEVAANDGSFKTLSAALKASGLDKALAQGGPYTIFAPTDKAFAALPKGTLEKLLKPENRDTLVKILTYHVVPGQNTSGTLQSGDTKTLEGAPVKVNVSSTGVRVNDAKVIKADILASNGVIHEIDKVLLPSDNAQQQPSGRSSEAKPQ